MGYKQLKLFVKPSSLYPYTQIIDYFVNYCNIQQIKTQEYIIGDLYNSRDNELLAIFSDKTKHEHGLQESYIHILKVNELQSESTIPEPKIDYDYLQNMIYNKFTTNISPQQIFNEIVSKIYFKILEKEESLLKNIELTVSKYLITRAN